MNAQQKENLINGGINIEEALARFMGNEAMLEKYLNRFLNEKSFAALAQAVAADDQEGAQAAVHTLKSVCGTIGCDAMHQLVVAQEAAMRAGDWTKATNMMAEIQANYDDICATLKANL